MSNYTGVRCPACNKKFTDADDVVVCPQCGAPHHRECYAQNNACVFAAEHMSGKEWTRPQEAPPPPPEGEAQSATRTCQSCGAANPWDSIFCQVCGARVSGPGAQDSGQHSAPSYNNTSNQQPYGQGGRQVYIDPNVLLYGGMSPDDEIGGERVRDLAVYIGPNATYYLPRFQRFQAAASSISVNFAAFFLNFVYYFYRKMYLIGALLLGLFAVCMIPYCLYIREMLPELVNQAEFMALIARTGMTINLPSTEVNYALANTYETLSNILWMVFVAVGVILSSFANKLYYKKVISEVSAIRRNFNRRLDPSRYNVYLSYQGGVNVMGVILAVGLCFVIYCASATLAFYGLIL